MIKSGEQGLRPKTLDPYIHQVTAQLPIRFSEAWTTVQNQFLMETATRMYGEYAIKVENDVKVEDYREKLISLLDDIKKNCPEMEIIVDAPANGNCAKLGDANIYEDTKGRIVIDTE